MAKQEEKRDDLFGMNVGDGLIEIDEQQGQVKEKEVVKETSKKEEVQGVSIYDDGTFEINDFPEKTEDDSVEEETEEFIEKQEKKEKGKASSDSDDSSDSSPSSSPYLAFAKDRASEGVFLEFTDDDWVKLVEDNEGDEAAALRQLSQVSMVQMVQHQVEAYKQSLTAEERALYEAKEKGIPIDEYGIAKRNFEKYSNIKKEDIADNEQLQEELVTKALELRGFSKEEIQEEIEGYKALENLEGKAEKALSGLPKIYESKIKDLETAAIAEEESRKDKLRQRVAKMKQMVDQIPEIIPGIKLTKPTREKIMQSMTTPVAKDEQGNPMNPVMATRAKNPEAFEMMLHYYHQMGLFNIDENGTIQPDFSKISKFEKTKATDHMRSIFETTEKQVSGKTKKVQTTDDDLDDFDKAFSRL
jgi:hypothetical protein